MGLQLRSKTPKRRVKAKLREGRAGASAANEVWAMDFVHDQLFDSRKIRRSRVCRRRSMYARLIHNKEVYIALGVAADGTKDVLGLWIENTEGAKFWLKVMNELRTVASATF
jgi:hypothetical protein